MNGFLIGIILLLFLAWYLALTVEIKILRDFHAKWLSLRPGARVLLLLVLAFGIQTQVKGGKGVTPVQSLMRMIFWNGNMVYDSLASSEEVGNSSATLASASNSLATAAAARISATNNAAAAVASASTQSVYTLSFDWHVPNRLPSAPNVMGWTTWVQPTNIAGVLYEDHYVAFNSQASTNPVVVNIEYARGSERFTAAVVTNSYPSTSVIHLQSGSHTCYWSRCAVPAAYVNEQRDWNGEALFGAPSGSGQGFDLLGTLVVDSGDNFWAGVSTNILIGASTNIFENGVNVTPGGTP